MDIKKHYKIFISIIIVIILISAFIVYDIASKKINYNDNGKYVDIKYFGGSFPPVIFDNTGNYTVSSCYLNHNTPSYMNSTITDPRVLPCSYGNLFFGINIHLKNINNKYLYLDINSKSYPSGYETCLSNLTFINSKYINNVCEIKYKINGNNIIINCINIPDINNCIVNNEYNISIKIALNNDFYNLFHISNIKVAGIYGTVGLTPGCSDSGYLPGGYFSDAPYNIYLNSTFFIENNNTKNFHIVDIRDGNFYFFAKPYTIYKLYYINNNTLEEFKSYNGKNMSYIKTGSIGSCTPEPLYE